MSDQANRSLRINLGCGDEPFVGFVNIDLRWVPGMDLRADVLRLPMPDASVIDARAYSLLEHFSDPCGPLDELHRVLRPEGRLVDACAGPRHECGTSGPDASLSGGSGTLAAAFARLFPARASRLDWR